MKLILAWLILVAFTPGAIAADKEIKAHAGPVWRLRFSPDGLFFVTTGGEGVAKMWWTDCLCSLTSFKHDKAVQVYDADFFPDGRVISTGLDGSIYVWFRETGAKLKKIEGHTENAPRVRVSPGGKTFLTASSDDTIRIYDSQSYEIVNQIKTKSPAGALWAGDHNEKLFWASLAGLQLWSLADKKIEHTFSNSAYYFAVEPAGQSQVLTGGNSSQGAQLKILNALTGEVIRTFEDVPGSFWQLSVSRDENWVGGSTLGGATYVWDRMTGTRVFTSDERFGKTLSLDFVPEGRALLIGSNDGIVRVARF